MCGICGKINTNGSGNISEALLRGMCDALRHRGPDDEGIYIKDAMVGLGHRRLSIIDLSSAGRQPMSNEDGTVRIVMNGEIYNFLQLRETLKKKGHTFKSRTDTEVILHLYEEKGTECLHDLRGMFAFAIWDEKKKELLLARDRLGQKPLYYAEKDNCLTFASEIAAVLKDTRISREVDFASIDDFLNYQYIPAPFTIFKDIKKLPPAHFLTWQKGRIKIERYWSLDYSKKLRLKTEAEYCSRIRNALEESVKLRLISDVPLGAFLSGGIDSSVTVALMAKLSSGPVKTFSIGFQDKSFNETDFAREVSDKFATTHKEFTVRPDALEVLPELIRHFGEPYGDSSAVPAYYLSKLTRQDVTVALSGDAGDEAFGGYERYVANKLAGRFKSIPLAGRKFFAKFISNIPESTRKKDSINRIKRFLNSAATDKKDRYSGLMAVMHDKRREEIYTDFMKGRLAENSRENIISAAYRNSGTDDVIDSTLFTDLLTYMPGDLLPKVDITSMAHSLEARSPFLDHKFLEFSASLPSNLKVKGLTTKYILKKSFKGILPDRILKRQKAGFGVPVGSWFKNELKDYAREILTSDRCTNRKYFRKDKIKDILDSHTAGKANHGPVIWSLLVLELWHRIFIDKE